MRFPFVAIALVALTTSACASREARVRTALVKTGLPPPVADCMAERMVDRLSIGQLRRLQSLSGLKNDRVGELTVGEFLELARTLGGHRDAGRRVDGGCGLRDRQLMPWPGAVALAEMRDGR